MIATLEKIKYANPKLTISGQHHGDNFNDEDIIREINSSKPDILIVGLGFPEQEIWILKNHSNIDCKVIIAVGEGIKVFAGTKIRAHELSVK